MNDADILEDLESAKWDAVERGDTKLRYLLEDAQEEIEFQRGVVQNLRK